VLIGGLVSSIFAGCAHRPAAPVEVPLFYIGSHGQYDYFHEGAKPETKTNYRLERGVVDVGAIFQLTSDAKRWRRIEIPKEPPATEPSGAPPTTGPSPVTSPAPQPVDIRRSSSSAARSET
jgi:hypothetical protein